MGAGASTSPANPGPESEELNNQRLISQYKALEASVSAGVASYEHMLPPEKNICEQVHGLVAAAAEFKKLPGSSQKHKGGDEEAMYQLALILSEGRGVERDDDTAIFYLREASSRKHWKSTFLLGELYYQDRVPGNNNNGKYFNQFKAVKLWTEVADEHHYVPAFERLAEAYKTGIGVMEADPVKSADYYAKVTNRHVADAYTELAEMHEKGSGGVLRDYSKAASLFEFSAQQGNVKAKYHLGTMYMDGRGVERDKVKGEALFKDALDAGLSNAQYHQAILLARKKGSDVFKAIGLLNHAARQGHERAKLQLERIKNGLVIEDDEITVLSPKKVPFMTRRLQQGVAQVMLLRSSPGNGLNHRGNVPAEPASAPEEDEEKYSPKSGQARLDVGRRRICSPLPGNSKGGAPWSPQSPMGATYSSRKKLTPKMHAALGLEIPGSCEFPLSPKPPNRH